VTKKSKLYWNMEGEAEIRVRGKYRTLAVIECRGGRYVALRRRRGGKLIAGSWGLLAEAKRAVEECLGMERGR
jgi:hypothetical protein